MLLLLQSYNGWGRLTLGFFFFWAWDFPEGGVGDQQCGGVRQWGRGKEHAAETMDLQRRAGLHDHIWEKCVDVVRLILGTSEKNDLMLSVTIYDCIELEIEYFYFQFVVAF